MTDIFAPPTPEELSYSKANLFSAPTSEELGSDAKFNPLEYEQKIYDKVKPAAQMLGKASEYLSKYTSAPIRAGIGAAQEGAGFKGSLQAARRQFGEDPSLAPTGKDIAANAGLSTNESITTPIVTDPFTNSKLKLSPAGIAGTGIDVLTDPLTYVGGELAGAGVKGVAKVGEAVSPEIAKYLELQAAKRAVKAASGGSDPNLRQILGVPMRGGTKEQTQKAILREGGKLLNPNEEVGTEKTVGWTGNFGKVGDQAEKNLKVLKERFNDIGDELERVAPQGVVSGQQIGDQLIDYAISIPDVGSGTALRNRVLEEAIKLQKQGDMSFNQAQKVKGQFKFNPQGADALISDQDVTNKIKQVITNNMDDAVAKVADMPGSNKALLDLYPQLKQEYGTAKNVASGAADQYRRDISRRAVSPSSHAAGSTAAIVTAIHNPALAPLVIAGAGAAAGNQIALKQGPAFFANLFNTLSKAAKAAPEVYGKYGPIMEEAAKRGEQSLLVTHHTLMENDPQYRGLFNAK